MEGNYAEILRARGRALREQQLPLLAKGDRDSWSRFKNKIALLEAKMSSQEKEAFEAGVYYRDQEHQLEAETVATILCAILKE